MVSGRHVVAAIAAAVLATMVAPPVGAWWLNERRVSVTEARLAASAESLRPTIAALGDGVTCAGGRVPDISEETARARQAELDLTAHAQWLALARVASAGELGALDADGWGRCLLLRTRSAGTPALLLSAGTNGVIETGLDDLVTRGDDLGVVVK